MILWRPLGVLIALQMWGFVSLPKQKVLVGAPGAGKSKLSTTKFSHCTRVNQDTLKTKPKCVEACRAALSAGKSVVIDNQNKSAADRKAYLNIAKEFKSEAFAIYLDVPKDFCFHLNTFRMLDTGCAEHKPRVPSMVIHSFYKYVEPPTEQEGFSEVFNLTLNEFAPAEGANVELLRSFLG